MNFVPKFGYLVNYQKFIHVRGIKPKDDKEDKNKIVCLFSAHVFC